MIITVNWAKEYDKEMYELMTNNEEMAKEIFNIDKEGPKPRKDFAKWKDVREKSSSSLINYLKKMVKKI